jgi:hypothetical protein
MALTTVNPAMIGQTSTGAASLTATGSAAASLVTAAGTALSANSSGYITTPLQPAFLARATSTTSTTGVLPYPSVILNIGSAFSTSTNRFTAPVAGVYCFFVLLGYIPSNSTNSIALYVRVNGVNQSSSEISNQPLTVYNTVSTFVICQLSAGDYVDAYAGIGGVSSFDNGIWNYFTGRLLG